MGKQVWQATPLWTALPETAATATLAAAAGRAAARLEREVAAFAATNGDRSPAVGRAAAGIAGTAAAFLDSPASLAPSVDEAALVDMPGSILAWTGLRGSALAQAAMAGAGIEAILPPASDAQPL